MIYALKLRHRKEVLRNNSNNRKGKPVERQGRKVTDLTGRETAWPPDCLMFQWTSIKLFDGEFTGVFGLIPGFIGLVMGPLIFYF
jgi:hypothetical protein